MALALNGAVTALSRALSGNGRPAQRAAVASSAAALSARRAALVRSPVGLLLAGGRCTGPLRGAAVCCSATSADDVVEVELKVDGMVCDGCSSRVEEALQKLPGVKKVHVDLDKGIATVQVEAASQIDAFNAMPKMVETVTGLGFEAQPHFGQE